MYQINPFFASSIAQKDVFLAIGDSNSAGKGRVLGPVTGNDTLYQWNGASLDQITTTDISTNTPLGTYGTSYKSFATSYKAAFGRSVAMVTHGYGGSEFYPALGTLTNWYTSGTLYAPAKAAAEACLASLGQSTLKGIILNLGINDVRHGVTIGFVRTGIDSLFTRLLADFPGVPILVVQVGTFEGPTLNTDRVYSVRERIRFWVAGNANISFVSQNCAFFQRGATDAYYDDEDLHLDQSGNNIQGEQFTRWFQYQAAGYSKEARSILSSCITELNLTQRNLVAAFVDGQVTAGNYYRLEMLFLYFHNATNNIYLDFGFMWGQTDLVAPITHNAGSDVETDGVATFIANFNQSLTNNEISSQNDVLLGAKLKQNLSPNPSNGCYFGGRLGPAVAASLLIQVSGGVGNFNFNDATTTNHTYTRLADNKLYTLSRNGTSKQLIVDTTVDTSATVTSTGKSGDAICLGALNTVDVRSLFMASKTQYMYAARKSGFDLTSFYNAMETMIAGW